MSNSVILLWKVNQKVDVEGVPVNITRGNMAWEAMGHGDYGWGRCCSGNNTNGHPKVKTFSIA